MTQEGLKKLLNEFMALPLETEWLEFKEAKENYDFSKLGKYFSALTRLSQFAPKNSRFQA